MNLGKMLAKVATTVKKNPEIALVLAGVLAPKLAKKAADVIVKVNAAKDLVK